MKLTLGYADARTTYEALEELYYGTSDETVSEDLRSRIAAVLTDDSRDDITIEVSFEDLAMICPIWTHSSLYMNNAQQEILHGVMEDWFEEFEGPREITEQAGNLLAQWDNY